MFFKKLETDKLYLKNISSDHRDFIFTVFSNDTINRYLFDEEPLTDIQGADEIINFYTQPEPRMQHRWIIVRKTDNSKLSACGFHAWDKSKGYCEVGYDLLPDYWGNGYMSEVMEKILEFATLDMKVKNISVCIYTDNDNDNSIKLAEKFGFVFKGQMKDYGFRGQKYPYKYFIK
jgi:ribosomal-protein-alanine N-acetyltransferase